MVIVIVSLIPRPYGTLHLLYALMSEVVKDIMENHTEEETWSWVARDVLLDTWTTILMVYAFYWFNISIKILWPLICLKYLLPAYYFISGDWEMSLEDSY